MALGSAPLGQWPGWRQGHLRHRETLQGPGCRDLVGLPDLLVEQHVDVTLAQQAQLVGVHRVEGDLAVVRQAIGAVAIRTRGVSFAQQQDRQAEPSAGIAVAVGVGNLFLHGDVDGFADAHE